MIEKAGIRCEGISGAGNPQQEILKAAKSEHVSYIVVGARRFRYMSRMNAFGNVGRNVIDKLHRSRARRSLGGRSLHAQAEDLI